MKTILEFSFKENKSCVLLWEQVIHTVLENPTYACRLFSVGVIIKNRLLIVHWNLVACDLSFIYEWLTVWFSASRWECCISISIQFTQSHRDQIKFIFLETCTSLNIARDTQCKYCCDYIQVLYNPGLYLLSHVSHSLHRLTEDRTDSLRFLETWRHTFRLKVYRSGNSSGRNQHYSSWNTIHTVWMTNSD